MRNLAPSSANKKHAQIKTVQRAMTHYDQAAHISQLLCDEI